MNEIEDFLKQIDATLKRLNLPSLLLGEPSEEDTHELSRQRIAMCFPNLTEGEQLVIRQLNVLAKAIPYALSCKKLADGDTNPRKLAAAKTFLQQGYANQLRDIDASGVRARLSDFQENVLDYLLEIRPVI